VCRAFQIKELVPKSLFLILDDTVVKIPQKGGHAPYTSKWIIKASRCLVLHLHVCEYNMADCAIQHSLNIHHTLFKKKKK
jgi:hypothetical protein